MAKRKPQSESSGTSVMDQVSERVGGKPAETTSQEKTSAEETPTKPAEPSEPAEEKKSPQEAADPSGQIAYRDLRVPMDEIDLPRFRLHLDINLQGEQAIAIRKVASALDKNRATLKNGRRCTGVNDAVRWLIEKLESDGKK